MRPIGSTSKSAVIAVSAALASCVSPGELEQPSLAGYILPAREKPADPPPEQSDPASASALDSQLIQGEGEASHASSDLRVILQALENRGIRFGLNADQIQDCLGPFLVHDLTQTARIAGTSRAGVFEAVLEDEEFRGKHPQSLIRKGTIHGGVEGFMGIMFPADGVFEIHRLDGYDTLSFQLVNSAIARLDAQFLRLHSDASQCFFSFSVTTGLLASVFGVPETHTEVHVPIRVEASGVLRLHFDTGEVAELVKEAANILIDDKNLNAEALTKSLKISAPMTLYAYENVPKLAPSPAALLFPIPTLLEDAYSRCSTYAFPEIKLSYNQEAGAETNLRISLVAISSESVYFTVVAPTEKSQQENEKDLLSRYTSVKRIADGSPLFTMSLIELKKHQLPRE